MFKGKAELVDPEKNSPVATFTETCQSDGTAKMKVVLKAPITLSGTERLAIFSTVKDEEVIAVTANGGASTAIHEFEGTSSLGCLADKSDIDQKSRWSSRNAPCRGRKGDDPRGTVLTEMLREHEFVLEVVGTAIGEFSNKRALAIALALGGVPGSGNSDGSLLN